MQRVYFSAVACLMQLYLFACTRDAASNYAQDGATPASAPVAALPKAAATAPHHPATVAPPRVFTPSKTTVLYHARSQLPVNHSYVVDPNTGNIVFSDGADLLCIDARGKLRWRLRDFNGFSPTADMQLFDSQLLVLTVMGRCCILSMHDGRTVRTVNLVSKGRNWAFSLPGVFYEDHYVNASLNGALLALDLSNWQPNVIDLPHDGNCSNVALSQGRLLVASSRNVYRVQPKLKTAQPVAAIGNPAMQPGDIVLIPGNQHLCLLNGGIARFLSLQTLEQTSSFPCLAYGVGIPAHANDKFAITLSPFRRCSRAEPRPLYLGWAAMDYCPTRQNL